MAVNNIETLKLGIEGIPSPNTRAGEVDGIEFLVNMAKQGKIDPWNVDIVDVYDNYMMQMFKAKGQNLKITGRTILFAAILLRLKSNILKGIDIMDFDPPQEIDEFEYNDDQLDYSEEYIPTNNVISIDEVLQRRTSVRLNHNRVVTLRDLIRQLEFYEMLDKKQSLKNAHERAKRRVQNYARLSPEDIINLAHDEYIENGVERLRANLEEILNRQDRIELNELTLLGMDRVNAYISLLFLTVDSNYDLVQDEFYGDLYVVRYEAKEELTSPLTHPLGEVTSNDEDNIFDAVNNITSVLDNGGANDRIEV